MRGSPVPPISRRRVARTGIMLLLHRKDGVVPDDARLLARVVKAQPPALEISPTEVGRGGFIDVSGTSGRPCDERLKIDGKFAKNQRDKIEKRWSLHRAKLLKDNNSADTPVDTAVYTTTATAPKGAEESRSRALFPRASQPPHTQSPGREMVVVGRLADQFEIFWRSLSPREAAIPKGQRPKEIPQRRSSAASTRQPSSSARRTTPPKSSVKGRPGHGSSRGGDMAQSETLGRLPDRLATKRAEGGVAVMADLRESSSSTAFGFAATLTAARRSPAPRVLPYPPEQRRPLPPA